MKTSSFSFINLVQDLQEAKDELLVETADMLHVPLFTAEALLRNHEWSKETLLNAWIDDAEECCERSGVQLPNTFVNSSSSAAATLEREFVDDEVDDRFKHHSQQQSQNRDAWLHVLRVSREKKKEKRRTKLKCAEKKIP